MRTAALLLALLALAGCGSRAPRAGSLADLTVRVDLDGPRGAQPARVLRLRCTQPTDSEACGAAAGVSDHDLAPTPRGRACTQIYGGPQTATIVGTLRGERVDARFSRADGCEIARWNGVADLLREVR